MLPERFLQAVERPARYIGGELNQVVKPTADVRIALCYPDVYEIGMSHQGLRILYEVVNRRPDAAAERVFLPWTDAVALMREQGITLTGLESGTPLDEFDLVGVTLQHELNYTNTLALLDLGGIPPLAAEREGRHPLVIGGGPCAFNPEPMADFFDIFVIGDGEEALNELLDFFLAQPGKLTNRATRSTDQRAELIARTAQLPGVYVPAGYRPRSADTGQLYPVPVDDRFPPRVTRRIVLDLDAQPYPTAPVVPYCETVHDRAEVEIARGCTRGCRFCQAGMIYR
ncbi:MAG: B12-binding domain-containing radical SAM protein, partial [Armatimonadetes bacterium]|nr:B12-binding domain-containing radical SAM protein [Armatimonadota bacterium]